jgi:hypothetical protein
MGSSKKPQLKSVGLAAGGYGTDGAGTLALNAFPADAFNKPAFVLFGSCARTNSTTGQIRMGSVTLNGYGGMGWVSGLNPGANATNPSYMFGYYLPDGFSASPPSITWDYAGSQYAVSTAVYVWLIYGRRLAGWGATGERPAGGITCQGIRDDVGYPGVQGYTSEDFTPALNGNFVRFGRWFGPSAGSHPAGNIVLTLSPA